MVRLSKQSIDQVQNQAIDCLIQLIQIPSLSKEEGETADHIERILQSHGISAHRFGNNVWAYSKNYAKNRPTVLLNSHHDTVKPNNGYSRDPFDPLIEHGKLYGLGSNDAGGALVSLLFTFVHLHERDLPYNLLFLASAEEEISGTGGVAAVLNKIDPPDFGIVGEPTEMKMAIAEKGLMVLDCYAKGKSGHAAREEGENAIYRALADIEWFRTFQFPITSKYLGPVKMSVTMVDAGYQHNVVPDECHFVVDVRGTDAYSNEEMVAIIEGAVNAEIKPRSTRLQPSFIPEEHPVLKSAKALNIECYGSPTLSDQALMPFPTVKIGPGHSSRSHAPDEFIYVEEIKAAIKGYLALLENIEI